MSPPIRAPQKRKRPVKRRSSAPKPAPAPRRAAPGDVLRDQVNDYRGEFQFFASLAGDLLRAFAGFRPPAGAPPDVRMPWPPPASSPAEELARDRALFGLREGFSRDDLRRAYKRLAIEAHPDRGGDDARMAQVNLAHARLQRVAT